MALLSLFWMLLLQFCNTITCKGNGENLSKVPAIFAFGDSVFDTGNNNYITTRAKGNHVPYGIDFPGRIPTGRFSNGKLFPDMMASLIGLKDTVPPFLQPNLSDEELLTGVSFASAGSGLDNQTTASSKSIPVSKQPEFFLDYIERLKRIAGEQEAQRIVSESLVVINAGTNDFLNFHVGLSSKRRSKFSVGEYQDFLQNNLEDFLKILYDIGCRKMLVSGLPPLGCLPLTITTKSLLLRKCIERVNSDAQSYNEELMRLLPKMQANLPGSIILYADVYSPITDMINNPKTYGFEETGRGCCGTGLFESGAFCNRFTPVCKNTSKYIFWDSVHPSESTYRHLAGQIAKQLNLSPN